MLSRFALPAIIALLAASSAMALPPQATGYNVHGQLGDGTLVVRKVPVPSVTTQTFTSVAGGNGHSLGLTANGVAWAWGNNSSGQVGDGTTLPLRSTPVAVDTAGVLAGRTVQAIAAQGDSSYALLDDESVAAWGLNLDGELGDGSTTNRLAPVLVSGLSGVTAIGAGRYHGLAVVAGGAVRAWGYNGQGQLGDNTLVLRTAPVSVSGLTGVTAVAGGDYHSVALLTDGTLRAWGFNGSGQLGDNSVTQRKTPVVVAGLTNMVQIAAGALHTVARKNDGTVWTWGENGDGQLGLGDNNDRTTPQQVPGITTAIAITAGAAHTLVLLSDGTYRGFGDNSSGQLGDGTTIDRISPITIPSVMAGTGMASGRFHSFFLAPIPPLVTAGAATSITKTTATLNGTVNPRGTATTAHFEYGLTTNYGSTAVVQLSQPDGNEAEAVSAQISGLEAGKIYLYRLVATNTGGTSTTASQSLTTRSLFAQWKLDELGDVNAPSDGDPDKDGLKNILEYAFGGDPTEQTSLPPPTLVNGRLTITFPRATAAADVTITVQASENLTQWTDIAASDRGAATVSLVEGVEVSETGTGATVTVEVRDKFASSDPAHPRRFLRIQVTE